MLTLVVVAMLGVDPGAAPATAAAERLEDQAVVLSAWICWERELKAGALSNIADEKKKAQIAGVQNLMTLNEAGDTIIQGDKEIAWATNTLKALKKPAQKCSAKAVAARIGCFDEVGRCESTGQRPAPSTQRGPRSAPPASRGPSPVVAAAALRARRPSGPETPRQ